jgi:hypothetical protein
MRLFSRRKAAVAEATAWQPVDPDYEILTGDDADMDDDGQATGHAYVAVFGYDAAPDALISVATYVTHARDGGYGLGLRYDYIAGGTENWVYAGYADDPEGDVFSEEDAAEMEAADWASALAGGSVTAMGNLPTVFEWDGEPFPVGDPG